MHAEIIALNLDVCNPQQIGQSRPSGHDNIADIIVRGYISLMTRIDATLLDKLPLSEITKVTFYKRDEITTDLICCDVENGEGVWTFHEELVGWDLLINYLVSLPSFRNDWFNGVSQPPFAANETVAFTR